MAFASPARWTVRTRSTLAATLVVTVCLLLAGATLLFVLFQSLQASAQATAMSRATQLTEELRSEAPSELDRSMLATDSQVGVVQVLDQNGTIVARSAGSPAQPIVDRALQPGSTETVGHVVVETDRDLWVIAAGVDTPVGPVTVLVGADREPAESVIATVATFLAVGAPIAITLVGFGTYRLVGTALQPVEQIRSRVASMTSGSLAERVPVPSADDEITRLAVTMNDMLDRLEASHVAQRQFISDASHELRSPLATISAALDLAHRRPEEFDRSLIEDSLLPESERMRTLVEDLLLLARADEREHRPNLEVDLDDIMHAEAQRARDLTRLKVETAIEAARVLGDPGSLARLVRNLSDNAIRHADSAIRFECAQTESGARIVISDDGPGIPESERARVFDRFVRLDSPRDRQSGGAGLGLAIVSQIAQNHRGSVAIVESSSGGACFIVTLSRFGNQPVSDAPHRLDAV